MEGRAPLTGEKGADLVPASCLTPPSGDRGSGHVAVSPNDRDLGCESDPSWGTYTPRDLDTEDLGAPPNSCVKTNLTVSSLPALMNNQAGH